jgi:hypothetical protein
MWDDICRRDQKRSVKRTESSEDTLLGAPFYFPIEAEPKPALER